MMKNLAQGLSEKIERATKILGHYEEIGPAGFFGASMIRQAIKEGHEAAGSGDVVRMTKAYKELEDIKE